MSVTLELFHDWTFLRSASRTVPPVQGPLTATRSSPRALPPRPLGIVNSFTRDREPWVRSSTISVYISHWLPLPVVLSAEPQGTAGTGKVKHQSVFEAHLIPPNLSPLRDRLVRGSLCNRRGELPECQGPARRRSPGYIQVRDSTVIARDLHSRTFPRHFIAYEQETSRNVYINKTLGGLSGLATTLQLPISSNLDDKTTHETYLWSFAEAVRAGTSSVMSSYNIINGTHGSANSDALNGLLKTELNFQGFVVSDWGGEYAYNVYGRQA